MLNNVLGLPFAAIALVCIALWLMLYSDQIDELHPGRRKLIGNVFVVLAITSLIMQVLLWSKVI
jgi:hypothetical protein